MALALEASSESEQRTAMTQTALCGMLGSGRFSAAEAAADAIIARTARAVGVGESASLAEGASTQEVQAGTVRTVTHVPLTTGSPPQIALSGTI